MKKLHTNFQDITGQKFGRLKAVSYAYTDKRGRAVWLCLCDCGNTTTVVSSNLKCGTNSCGCLKKEMMSIPPGESFINEMMYQARYAARRAGRIFEIARSLFSQLIGMPCFYCGSPPPLKSVGRKGRTIGHANGLDRVDNKKGYVEDNVVTCCKACNVAKATMSQEEFISLAHRIAKLHPNPRNQRHFQVRADTP
jgi:hypothetical protein